jgi:F0F1-type ATP synthase assembly protein I
VSSPDDDTWRRSLRDIAPYLGLGVQLAAAVLLFFFIGWWVDTTYDTGPFGMLIGVAVGMTGGMISFIRTVTSKTFTNDASKNDGTR